jgi:hypothetical protein
VGLPLLRQFLLQAQLADLPFPHSEALPILHHEDHEERPGRHAEDSQEDLLVFCDGFFLVVLA